MASRGAVRARGHVALCHCRLNLPIGQQPKSHLTETSPVFGLAIDFEPIARAQASTQVTFHFNNNSGAPALSLFVSSNMVEPMGLQRIFPQPLCHTCDGRRLAPCHRGTAGLVESCLPTGTMTAMGCALLWMPKRPGQMSSRCPTGATRLRSAPSCIATEPRRTPLQQTQILPGRRNPIPITCRQLRRPCQLAWVRMWQRQNEPVT